MIHKPEILSKKEILEIWDETGNTCTWGEYARIVAQAQLDDCYKEMLNQFVDLLWATSSWGKDAQEYRDIVQSQLEEKR